MLLSLLLLWRRFGIQRWLALNKAIFYNGRPLTHVNESRNKNVATNNSRLVCQFSLRSSQGHSPVVWVETVGRCDDHDAIRELSRWQIAVVSAGQMAHDCTAHILFPKITGLGARGPPRSVLICFCKTTGHVSTSQTMHACMHGVEQGNTVTTKLSANVICCTVASKRGREVTLITSWRKCHSVCGFFETP